MLKFLKWLSIILVTLVVALIAVIILAPQLIINERSVAYAVKYAEKMDVKITYTDLKIEVSSDDSFNKVIKLIALDFCVTYKTEINTCFGSLDAQTKINLLGQPVVLTEVGPIIAQNGQIAIKQVEDKKIEEEEPFDWRTIKDFIKHTKIRPLVVDKTTVKMTDLAGKVTEAKFDLKTTQLEGSTVELVTLINGKGTFPIRRLALTGKAIDRGPGLLPDIDVKFDTSTPSGLRANAVISLLASSDAPNERSNLKIDGNLLKDKTQLAIKATGSASFDTLILDLTLNGQGLAEGLRKATIDRCIIDTTAKNDYTTFVVQIPRCRISLVRNLIEKEAELPVEFPKTFEGKFVANMNIDVGEEIRFSNSSGRFDLVPLINDLYKMSGGLDFVLNGSLGTGKTPNLALKVDSVIELDRFERLVKHLENSNYSIPAPLNTLAGKAGCDIKGEVNLAAEKISVPHTCSINLRGDQQALVVEESGVFSVQFVEGGIAPDLVSNIVLREITMFLPDFSVTDPVPKMTTDKRFVDQDLEEYVEEKKEELTSAKPPFSYTITVRTADKPILIHTPSLKTVVPIKLDIALSSDKRPIGSVNITRFDVKILSKSLIIDHVTLSLADASPNKIDAKALIERTEFDVIVNIYGDLEKPKVEITSDPLRADSDLMSSLMYGGSFNDLDSSQQKSVAETRAAMTDGAIGLISMFYLATTPIESVGYNPHTQQFRAEVKLGTGASLQVGSNFEGQSELGIRKRLRGNWFFETYAISEEERSGTKGVAMLKWANRY